MDEQFIVLLKAAVEHTPGFLKIITDEVHPDIRQDTGNARSQVRAEKLQEDEDILRKPSSFVLHDVVAIEPHPSREGVYRAVTAEGDFCEGRPQALWNRLVQHQG